MSANDEDPSDSSLSNVDVFLTTTVDILTSFTADKQENAMLTVTSVVSTIPTNTIAATEAVAIGTTEATDLSHATDVNTDNTVDTVATTTTEIATSNITADLDTALAFL